MFHYLIYLSPLNEQVYCKLRSLKPFKSPGPDGFYPRIIKEAAEQLSLPLYLIFSKSLDERFLPTDWKVANVIPVFKKGDLSQPGNYRPISLTSTVCKVFESIIRNNIRHMSSNALFAKEQHGFLPRMSCITQLLTATEYWSEVLQQGDSVDVVYFDFRKAFDSVPHQRLLLKLKSYGIEGRLLDWITTFLTNRKQRVVINESYSCWSDVTSGIPQGSVLGPILFSLYINDLPDIILHQVLMFADDTKLFRRISRNNSVDDIASMQRDIDSLVLWSNKWQLSFNVSKCKFLHLGRSAPDRTYQIQNQIIEQVTAEKDLGIIIDNQMKFHQHVSFAASKAMRMIGVIRKTFCSISIDTFPSLYNTLIRPHLEYGNVIWGPFYVLDQNRIENVQRAATRLVSSPLPNAARYLNSSIILSSSVNTRSRVWELTPCLYRVGSVMC